MKQSTKILIKMVELNNSIRQNQIEADLINNNIILNCPYFNIPFCDKPDLRENNNNKCECFKFKLKQEN